MTLLKNEGDLLPLSKSLKSIAVIGPNADDKRNLLGDYAYPAHIESLITFKDLGFSEHPLPDAIRFIDDYDKMKSVSGRDSRRSIPGHRGDLREGLRLCSIRRPRALPRPVEAAKKAEVAIVVVGDKSGLVPDCSAGEFRDRATLGLPGVQQELVEAIHATGTPVIVVLVNGRPFATALDARTTSAALLEAWLPGDEGAQAIADVLFGDVNPGGKLPVTVVRSTGQTPLFYNHQPSRRVRSSTAYVDESNQPLFPFDGASYTSFKIGNLHVTPDSVDPSGELTVSVDVTNTGEMAGDEVVQICAAPTGRASAARSRNCAFKRVELAPGETKTVVFTVPVAQMNYYNLDMRRVVEPAALTVIETVLAEHRREHYGDDRRRDALPGRRLRHVRHGRGEVGASFVGDLDDNTVEASLS